MRYKLRRGLRRCSEILRSRSVAICLLASAVMLIFFTYITGLNLYVIFDGDSLTVHQSRVCDAGAALAEAGIQISRDDFVFLPDAPQGGVVEIHIERSQTVTIDAHGDVRRLSTLGATVGDVLTRTGIALGGRDVVEPDLTTPVTNGMTITIWQKETKLETRAESIPYTTERVASDTLLEGKEEVAQEGAPGEKTYYYEICLRNGTETDCRLIAEQVTTPAVNTVIRYGTKKPEPSPPPPPPPSPSPPPKPKESPKPSVSLRENPTVQQDDGGGGVLVTPDGEELRYSRIIYVTATAYTTEGHSNKLTYLGTTARVGAIAVDPKVIPLRTKVYVEVPGGRWFYGKATCEDTGGAIKGNRIDLFFNTEDECYRFGVRDAIVYILG